MCLAGFAHQLCASKPGYLLDTSDVFLTRIRSARSEGLPENPCHQSLHHPTSHPHIRHQLCRTQSLYYRLELLGKPRGVISGLLTGGITGYATTNPDPGRHVSEALCRHTGLHSKCGPTPSLEYLGCNSGHDCSLFSDSERFTITYGRVHGHALILCERYCVEAGGGVIISL